MTKNLTLEQRVAQLEARNQRVDDNKAWEMSWSRRIAIMLLTYLSVVAYLHFVVRIEPWFNALVPVLGFLLSTLTVSQLKKHWLKRFR